MYASKFLSYSTLFFQDLGNNLVTNQLQQLFVYGSHTAEVARSLKTVVSLCDAKPEACMLRWNRIESMDSACGAVLYMYALIAGITMDYSLRMKHGGSLSVHRRVTHLP